MSKLVAVWGCPGSGKTTVSVKLAEALYARTKSGAAIVVVFADHVTPVIPTVFPNYRSEEVYSIGTVLSKPDLFPDDVVSNLVTVKGRMNMGYIGFKDGENRFTYPEYTKEKVESFYRALRAVADYIIVDCMTMPEQSLLTEVALENAEQMIRLSVPDLKCLSFNISQTPIFMANGYLPENHIQVMNVTNQEFAMPVSDTRAHLGNIRYTIPFSSFIREQYMEGCLYEPTKDRKIAGAMKEIIERVV